MSKIREMLEETRENRDKYRREGRSIEALACAIRERALQDALDALEAA